MMFDGLPTFDRSDFSTASLARRIEKPWGFEVLLSPPTAPYTAKLIHVRAGHRLSLQLHDSKVETQTLVAGRGILVLEGPDGEMHDVVMEEGRGYHVAVGQRHRLCADPNVDAVVFEASTPDVWISYRLQDDFSRALDTDVVREVERSRVLN